MSTSFDDLVRDAQPCLIIAEAEATEGRSWEWKFTITGNDGTAPDLVTGVTTECKVLNGQDAVVLTLTATAGGTDNNEITITAPPSDTVGLANTTAYPWYLKLTNGSGRKLDVFGIEKSRLKVINGV